MLFLHDRIGINAVFKVKKCVDMEQIPAVLTLRSRPIGVLIRRVRAGFQRRTVHGQQSVAPELLLRAQTIREAVKQIFERGWKQLLPLLDKGRRRRRVDPPAEIPEQPLPDALFAHGENEMDQHSGRQCPFSGKIPTWLPRVPLRVFTESSNDGKSLSRSIITVFSCAASLKINSFSGLGCTFFAPCQGLFPLNRNFFA